MYRTLSQRILPQRATATPWETWLMLSTPQWASWLALARIELRAPLPGVGMVASGANTFVHVRAGVEVVAMFFPHPTEVGEPFYAVLARRPDTSLQTFVFERTLPMAALPMRALQVEYTLQHHALVRKEHCVLPTPSIETCLRKAAEVASASLANTRPKSLESDLLAASI